MSDCVKFDFNENEYINIEDKNIEIKYGEYHLTFPSLYSLLDAFKPGILRTCKNNNKLEKMQFESDKLYLFASIVYSGYCETEEFIIVARSLEEAELVFDNFLTDTYYDVEYDPPYELDLEDYDEDDLEYIEEMYFKNGIDVYDRCGI